MRDKHNSLAEKLWYIIKEAVDAGVTVEAFRHECKECWIEALNDRIKYDTEEFRRTL